MEQRLKGGSLSETVLITIPNRRPIVRKRVAADANREYGYHRWYSQLKRQQRYNALFPGLFPEILDYGLQDGWYFFDMEYVPDAVTLHELLTTITDQKEIEIIFRELMQRVYWMHSVGRVSGTSKPIVLYFKEEVLNALKACHTSPQFQRISDSLTVWFNGLPARSLVQRLPEFLAAFQEAYNAADQTQCFSHGNLTLENILIQPLTKRIVFIDVYEENVIDSALADFSQLLQSSNTCYELYNSVDVRIIQNTVTALIPRPVGLSAFNSLLVNKLCTQYPTSYRAIRLFEISQFVRMLPFKKEIDPDRMVLFYVYASFLFDEFQNGH